MKLFGHDVPLPNPCRVCSQLLSCPWAQLWGRFSLIAFWEQRWGWLAYSSLHTPSWTCALSLAFCSLQTLPPVIVTHQKGQKVAWQWPWPWVPWDVFLAAFWNSICQICFSGPFAFTLVPPLFYANLLCLCDCQCISCCRLVTPTSSARLMVG